MMVLNINLDVAGAHIVFAPVRVGIAAELLALFGAFVGGRRRRDAARRRRRCDGADQGLPDARPPRGPPRSARLGAGRRPGARAGTPRAPPDTRAPGAGTSRAPATARPGEDAGRRAASD